MPAGFHARQREGSVTRRQFSVIALAGVGSALRPALAQPSGSGSPVPALTLARSLPDELAAALQRRSPLVVMVSLNGCVYCQIVREHYLRPLVQQGLPVVQVDWRSSQPLQDFSAQGTHDEAVSRWRIRVAPTLLFFGPGGREVAPRLVGMSSQDFYGAYLEARLEEARRSTRA